MNRAEARNSLSLAMIDALHAAVTGRGRRPRGAVVLAAKGSVFCAGHDLKELSAHRADADKGLAFYKSDDPLLGHDAGDRRVPQAGHRRGARHRDRGRLPARRDLRSRGRGAKRTVLHAGRQHRPVLLDADGGAVAQRAAQAGDGDAAARRYAVRRRRRRLRPRQPRRAGRRGCWPRRWRWPRKIADKSPLTVAIGKAAFYAQAEMPLAEAYAYASKVMVDNMMARDAEEGIGAFLEKRKPEWKGS